MSKITDRREMTKNTKIENKAVLADGTKPKSEFPYKKILIIVLAVVAIIACVLLVANAFVDSYADKLATGESHENAGLKEEFKGEIKGELYENLDSYLSNVEFAKAYASAIKNHAKNYTNLKADPNVFNYVVTISSPETDADSAGLSAIMIVSVDKANNQVSYFSINKSMLSVIPEVGVGPLYDAYGFGGGALLTRAVEGNFGIKINGYVDMPLNSFVDATIKLGGIEIEDPTLTDDERKLDTASEIYNYVKNSENRNAAMTEVIKALASSSKEEGVFGIKKTIDTIVESLDSYISREDFGELIGGGTKVLDNDAKVYQIGYDTVAGVTKYNHYDNSGKLVWAEPYMEFSTVNYDTEVQKLQSNMFPQVEETTK